MSEFLKTVELPDFSIATTATAMTKHSASTKAKSKSEKGVSVVMKKMAF